MFRSISFTARAAWLAAAFFAGSTSLAAQKVTLTPYVGRILPMRSLALDSNSSIGIRSGPHTIVGLRAGLPLSDRTTLELGAAIGTGKLVVLVYEPTSSVVLADLRARVRMLSLGAGSDLSLLVGGGYIKYSDVYSDLTDVAYSGGREGTLTGSAGFAFRFRRPGLGTFTVDVADLIHASGTKGFLPDAQQRLQHDVAVSAGYVIPL
jgi:hypothetical protein